MKKKKLFSDPTQSGRGMVLLLVTALPLVVAACAHDSELDVGQSSNAIVGARVIDTTRKDVGRMNDNCTGTFLPGNLFLTAAHCVRANPGVLQIVNGVLESVAVPYVSDRIRQ